MSLSPNQIEKLVDALGMRIVDELRKGSTVGWTAGVFGVPEWIVVDLGKGSGVLPSNYPTPLKEDL